MRLLASVYSLMLYSACGGNITTENDAGQGLDAGSSITEIFYLCEAGQECETGYCANINYDFDAGPTVCTVSCSSQNDCKQIHVNSRCLCNYTPNHTCITSDPDSGHCILPCWPQEDSEACKKYGLFCPSDCEAQGLVCGLVSLFPVNYACVTEN